MSKVKIAVFGEILWDIFGEEKTIGGAPFNFAAHSSKLGADVKLISAVGKDALGDAAVEAARGLGISTDGIASVDVPTGYCRVTLSDGKPSYDLVRGVAYDMIPPPQEEIDADALYFGTLASRGEVSAKTLEGLLGGDFREVFFDINIRQNYYTDELIDYALCHATIFKLSREEMGAVSSTRHATLADARSDGAVPPTQHATLADARPDGAVSPTRHATLADARSGEDVCRMIAARYPNLRLIILTLDRDGALVYEVSSGRVYHSPVPESKPVSTVGAGDSFSACFLVNYLRGMPIDVCLYRAVMLSDYVVTQLGAVPDYPESLMRGIVHG